MSASRERKKRAELTAQGISAKQLKAVEEKKRKKKNTLVGIICAVVAAAILLGCLYFLVIRPNMQPRKTVAATVGEHELSATQFSYYYYDSVNSFYQQYGSYLSYLIDTSTPIDEQVYDEGTGETWADYFIKSAGESAKQDYAVYDAAKKDGFKLSAETEQSVKDSMDALEDDIKANGFKSMKQYLTSVYGKGATEKSYYDYQILHATAAEYAQKIDGEREYSAEQIKAKYDENPNPYTNVSYRSFYFSSADFKEESVVDEAVDYVEEGEEDAAAEAEQAAQEAALAAAEEAAGIMAAKADGSEDKFIELAKENAGEANASYYEDPDATLSAEKAFDSVPTYMVDWLYEDGRKEGDTTVVSDGGNGYYALMFLGLEDNDYNLVDVRQILFQPETDEDSDGDGTPDAISDDAKAKAKADAEALLAKWQAGDHTEESFAALSDEQTGGTDGGLYTDIYHGYMVDSFNDWCFDPARKAGDAEVVETEYGYHVIYFSGECDNYRDSMIIADLKEADYDAWDAELTEGYDAVTNDAGLKFLRTDLVLGSDTAAEAVE